MSKRKPQFDADPGTNGTPTETTETTPPQTPAAELPVEQAIAAAIDALGPVAIDDVTAPKHLHALATAYDNRERARVTHERRVTDAKNAKAALDQATDHLLDMVKEVTHPKPLPLFDVAQAEADLNTMATAIQDARQ